MRAIEASKAMLTKPTPSGIGTRLAASPRFAARLKLGIPLALATCFAGCERLAAEPSACDGLSEKTLGITSAEYSPCARELLAALEALEDPLRLLVLHGDGTARAEAKTAYRRLDRLMDQVGFRADLWREAREGAGATVERWPDANTKIFNLGVRSAAAQFKAALHHPDEENFTEGSRQHEEARRAYSRFH